MKTLPRLTVLALLATTGSSLAAPSAPPAPPAAGTESAVTPTTAPAPATTQDAPTSINEAKTNNGLVISANLREDYVAGFPMLVTVTVRNDGPGPLPFPDLGARPHLVRFHMKKGSTKWERFNTPPASDTPAAWTIAPRTQRQVTLEIPSSGGLDPGDWELGVTVKDPAGDVTLPSRPVRLAVAKPVAGGYAYEPPIQQAVGAMIPWLQEVRGGFDLYMLQLAPKNSTRTLGLFHLARLPAKVDPVLSRARAPDAASRYLYWLSGPQSVTLARVEGTALRGKPRTVAIPYPDAELLGRGVTDARGGVIIPLWIPDPSGTSGTVRALCVDDRGGQVLREVTRLPARPVAVNTAVDAASNLLLALGHAAAVDLYRVDSSLPAEIGARGVRVTTLADGWTASGLAFDTLPDMGERAGGLSLLSVLTRPGTPSDPGTPPATYRALWSDLAGKTVQESAPLPWTAPGTLSALQPAGYGPFYYLTTDGGAVWYGAQAGTPQKVEGAKPGSVLWLSKDAVQARRLVDRTVFEDRVLGPLAQ